MRPSLSFLIVTLVAWLAGHPGYADDLDDIRAVLAEIDVHVTTGAAPGYVPDALCGTCHADKAESFAEVGMGKSFYRPSVDKVIEDFTLPPFFHDPSGRIYQISMRGDSYWFRRWRRAADGSEVDVFERRIDWIMGSGHHSRVYLYQTTNGELFQLPLAWYSQEGKWGMAPGFEFADHYGVRRPVLQRCMACHNGYADLPEGAGRPGMLDIFPHDMPEGIGCQRCHGPGARHAATALGGEAGPEEIRADIVNPGKLPRDQLYGICYGCHMQPTVAVNSGLRFGRGEFSFRPGEEITDFLAHLDIVDANRARHDRFDINHHPYRLEQSSCFTETNGALGCLTCHDPHVKRKPAERAAHYREACLTCHDTDDQGQVVMAATDAEHPALTPEDDCTACHMPARRTQDVIEVWMTDHKIMRHAPDGLLSPIPKIVPRVEEIHLLRPGSIPEAEATMQKAIAALSATNFEAREPVDLLEDMLGQGVYTDALEPVLALATAHTIQGRVLEAISAAKRALALDPVNPTARSLLAVAYKRGGRTDKAIGVLRELLNDFPGDPTARYNLARMLLERGQVNEAHNEAIRTLEQRDTHWKAMRLIAEIEAGRGNSEAAIRAYLATLGIEPRADRVRAPLSELLTAAGRVEEAARHAEP